MQLEKILALLIVTALAVAVDVDREKDKDCKQLVHMADSHMTCKQCGLALSRRKNNMTFLAHKLLTLLFHQIEPLKRALSNFAFQHC